jgi:hypothetical protein
MEGGVGTLVNRELHRDWGADGVDQVRDPDCEIRRLIRPEYLCTSPPYLRIHPGPALHLGPRTHTQRRYVPRYLPT